MSSAHWDIVSDGPHPDVFSSPCSTCSCSSGEGFVEVTAADVARTDTDFVVVQSRPGRGPSPIGAAEGPPSPVVAEPGSTAGAETASVSGALEAIRDLRATPEAEGGAVLEAAQPRTAPHEATATAKKTKAAKRRDRRKRLSAALAVTT